MRAAINETCKSCIYDDRAVGIGTWREQIEACTALDCPLYSFRPVSEGNRVKDRLAAKQEEDNES